MPRPPRDEQLILQIARLRYENGLPQHEIAEQLSLSDATISRYLKQALELGFIEIQVAPRAFRDFKLERDLVRRFDLASAIVVESRPTVIATRNLLGGATAQMLEKLIHDSIVIGVSNGETIASVAERMKQTRAKHLEVVTLIGGVGKAEEPSHSGRICRTLAEGIGAHSWVLPAPATVDRPDVAEALLASPAIHEVMSVMSRVEIAIVGIGSMEPGSSTFTHGLFSQDHLDDLVTRHAVGSICARFYDDDGHILSSSVDDCTLSFDLERLRQVRHRIGAAFGAEKRKAIRAAIRGRLINILGTDATTATALLKDD
jgi:DNA-binding transcriptional regulator LsrR (DeoR family)